jgi:putative DNA primase/helicase
VSDQPILRLFQELGRAETDLVSISSFNDITEWTSQQVPVRFADVLAKTLTDKKLNVYMMVNPVLGGGERGRGDANAVTALAALWVDIDYKDAVFKDGAKAREYIDMLSAALNCNPVAIVHSGAGLQPYWAIEDGNIGEANRNFIMGVLKRWGYLCQRMAEVMGGKIDSVFDLPRVLRAPGTMNWKYGEPVDTTIEFTGWSRPLTIQEVVETVESYGFMNENLTVDEFKVVSPPSEWEPAENDCAWSLSLLGDIERANLAQKSRHSWLVGVATRVEVAARNGCVTEATYIEFAKLVEQKFYAILAHGANARKPAPGEVTTAFAWARKLVSTFSDVKMADNLNYHKHRAHLSAVPDLPKGLPDSGTVSEFPTSGNLALAPEIVPIVLGDKNFLYTDAANGERLAMAAKGEYIYSPGLGWYTWDTGRYVKDEARSIIQLAIATARSTAMAEPSKDNIEWAVRSMMGASIANAIKVAETVPEVVVMPSKMDAEPLDLCTPGGIASLTDGTLRGGIPGTDLNSRQTAVTPRKGEMPMFMAFLNDCFSGDAEVIRYVQEIAGISLIGQIRWHILPVFVGPGANGKSVLLSIFGLVLGEYCAIMPENFLLDTGKLEHSTEIFRLRGVRMAQISETRPDGKFNESRVKALTAEPVLSARAIAKDFVDFNATHTLLAALNHPPKVHFGGESFWRRIKIIPFPNIVPENKRNPNLDREIFAAEGPQILQWMIEGSMRVLKDGPNEPASVKFSTAQYRSEEDHIHTFFSEMCVVSPESVFSNREIYATYVGWCKNSGEAPVTNVQLIRELRQRYPIIPTKIRRERAYQGVLIFSNEVS